MNATVAIARREIADKKFVLAAALAFAVIPFLLPLLSAGHGAARSTIIVAAGIFAAGFTVGLAAILGGSFIGRDVSDGRMSFFFARPVSSAAIYWGKLSAALLLVVVSFAIILGPALVFGEAAWTNAWTRDAGFITIVTLSTALALFLLAHVIGTFVRSHSPWIGLDFVLAVLAGIGVWSIVRPLAEAAAVELFRAVSIALAVAIAAAIIAAGAWQLANGRIDRRRNHLELSRFLWPALALVLAIGGGYVAWVVSASPKDIAAVIGVEPAHGGRHALVVATVNGRGDYHPAFLIDTATGAYARVAAGPQWGAEFTRDGSKMVIMRATGLRDAQAEVFVRDLATGVERDTGLTIPPSPLMVVNDDATRVAALGSSMVAVYDVPAKRSLASARLADSRWILGAFFDGPRTLRVFSEEGGDFPNGPRTLNIDEIDLATHGVRRTGSVFTNGKYIGLYASADGSRLLTRAGKGGILVADGRTGAVLFTLAPAAGFAFGSAAFLTDGGIAVGETAAGDASSLRLFNADGSPRATIPLGIARSVFPVREIAPGKVIAGMNNRSGWSTALVDLPTGAITAQQPSHPIVRNERGGISSDPRVGVVGTTLLMREGRKIVRWNALTGEKKVIAGG
jgi:ABC-type transport system involved in multi-copper enzyme maturation permease subunit